MKTKFEDARELIGRWCDEMYKANPDWSAEERFDYAANLLGKIRGLKAKDIDALYDFCVELAEGK